MKMTLRSGGNVIQIPVPPPEVNLMVGDQIVETIQIINLGPVSFPVGKELDALEWASFFPVRYDPGYCVVKDIEEPRNLVEIIEEWKDNNQPVRVTIPAMDISFTAQVRRFTWGVKGMEWDIYYDIQLVEHREINVRQVSTAATDLVENPKTRPASAAPQAAKPSTYAVKAGDSLTLIAKRLGTDWSSLYEKNKSVIGNDPGKIYPGQVLAV